jgi:ribosomal protein S18 acetylase RimI-like enzyme
MQPHPDTRLVYRSANADDIPQLIELGLISYGKYASGLTPDNWERMRTNMGNADTWRHIVADSASFLCTDAGAVVGMGFLMPRGHPWDMFPAEWSYIRMVGVHPGYEGRGIARRIMEQCVAHARTTGEKVIALHTSELMHNARHIYESMGFTVLRELPLRHGVRYWLYTMEL